MPVLPLDYPGALGAVVGTMLFPGDTEGDRRHAKTFAAQAAASALPPPDDLAPFVSTELVMQIAGDAGAVLPDVSRRWANGEIAGEIFKGWYVLSCTHPEFASLESAIKLYRKAARGDGKKASRSKLHAIWVAMRPAAHLWGAFAIRGRHFYRTRSNSYDNFADLQCFLTETELLRERGQNWRRSRSGAKPLLPADVWRVPHDWQSPPPGLSWPLTGRIPDMKLPDHYLSALRSPGRPKKVA